MSSFVIVSGPGIFPVGARFATLSHWLLVIYVSNVTFGCVGVWWGGGMMSKLSGFVVVSMVQLIGALNLPFIVLSGSVM